MTKFLDYDVHVTWDIKYDRLKKFYILTMLEIINNNPFFAAVADEAIIKIRFWDTPNSLRSKIDRKQKEMLAKYVEERNMHESFYTIAREADKTAVYTGKLRIADPASTVSENKTPDKLDKVVNLQDFLKNKQKK